MERRTSRRLDATVHRAQSSVWAELDPFTSSAPGYRDRSCCRSPRAPAMGGLAVPRALGNAALAQFVLLHLTAFGSWQRAHEFEISRNRERRYARFAKRSQLGFRELLA